MPYEVYRPSQQPSGMPVLFIHGWRSSPKMFHDLVTCLDFEDINCILPHFTSNVASNSEPTAHLSSSRVLDLIDELHIDRLGIVAFGMFGGSIARRLIHILGYNRFTFISLLSPGPCLIDTPARDAFWNMLPAETRASILDLPAEALDLMVNKAVDLFFVNGSSPSRQVLRDDLYSMTEEIRALSVTAAKQPGGCPVPVEVICGELDEIVPLELSFKTVRNFGEVHVSVIPLAGHHFVTDYYEETARCMREFLVERVIHISSLESYSYG